MGTDDESDLVESALDVFVYAPLGLALEVRELLPKLAERGRGQVAITRLMSRFAIQKGRNEATKLVEAAVAGFRDTVTASTDRPAHGPPLDDYDDLTAAEIIDRLADLSPARLRAVADYERSHRERVTVLNRIDQLQR